jgi:hypothetical protein
MECTVDKLSSYALRLLLACCALCCPTVPRAAAQAQPRVFALVITNNRSLDGSQPELQYADDDGARYYRLLRSVARAEDVALLTGFDRASKLLYPDLVEMSRTPSSAELLRARDRLAAGIAQAKQSGEHTVFYLVFAGHADLIDGRGVLQLEDRGVDGAFIENELLERLPAHERHVILDSCNSFFVMNPRKPGGRRWATPRDIALGFSARHPDVGLFLSTNSESEVFEWSELESGVFSHEVRSGMSGGADVNMDGAVSYLELAGFVERANTGITRESLRPHLYFRGPRGDQNAPLFATAAMRGRRVELGAQQTRLWIKDGSGERLLDLHKETGPLRVVIPEGAQRELALYVQHNDSPQVRVSELRPDANDEPVRVEQLSANAPALAARGSRLFGQLFTQPYGPAALAEYASAQTSQPAPVFGLKRADIDEMHRYLTEFAGYGRSQRAIGATMLLGYGALAGGAAIALATYADPEPHTNQIALAGSLSVGFLTLGLMTALRPSNGERALASFERELKLGRADGARAFAETDAWLERLATRERRRRKFTLWATQILGLNLIVAGGLQLLPRAGTSRDEQVLSCALLFSGGAMVSALGLAIGLSESPAERMLTLYRNDRGVQLQISPSVSRTSQGIGISGRF